MLIIVHYRRTVGTNADANNNVDQQSKDVLTSIEFCKIDVYIFHLSTIILSNRNVYTIKYKYYYKPILISLKTLAKIVNKKSRIHQFDIIPLSTDKKIKSTKFDQKISFFRGHKSLTIANNL